MPIKTIYLLLLSQLFLFGCSDPNGEQKGKEQNVEKEPLPYYQEATFTPVWINKGDQKALADFHKIPSFQLTNQLGELVTQAKFEQKIYVADFFFTSCPGICPQMTTNMHLLQEAFKEDNEVLLVSHSVTPQQDSVSILAHYADVKGILASKWDLLTGDRAEIYDLGRNFYFVEEDLGLEKEPDDFLHTENFVLIDQSRHIRGIYNGLNKRAIQQLIEDIKALKKAN